MRRRLHKQMQRRQQLHQSQAPGSTRPCICQTDIGACNASKATAPAAVAVLPPAAAVLADVLAPTPVITRGTSRCASCRRLVAGALSDCWRLREYAVLLCLGKQGAFLWPNQVQ